MPTDAGARAALTIVFLSITAGLVILLSVAAQHWKRKNNAHGPNFVSPYRIPGIEGVQAVRLDARRAAAFWVVVLCSACLIAACTIRFVQHHAQMSGTEVVCFLLVISTIASVLTVFMRNEILAYKEHISVEGDKSEPPT